MAEFYSIWTTIGRAKLAAKIADNQKLVLTQMAIGDGGKNDGSGAYQPTEDQTALKRERYRSDLAYVEVDSINANWLNTIMTIPPDVGGFFICEAGLFDDEGDMVAIASVPVSYKPVLGEGASKDITIKVTTVITNAEAVELKIDPTVTVATKEDVRATLATAKKYTDETAKETNLKLTEHTADGTIHVTMTEKTAWNANAGLTDKETVFNADGSITEVSGAVTSTTVFNSDGSITETVVDEDNKIKKIITTIFEGSSIKEEVEIIELG